MRVNVLGPVEVIRQGAKVDLGVRKQRALLAALALTSGRPVSTDALADLLWGDTPPPGVAGTLQTYVAGLRRALEPDRPPRAAATIVVTTPGGYVLRVGEDVLDAQRFAAVVLSAPPIGGPEARLEALDTALGLWRGVPFAELDPSPAVEAERARLDELRLMALEERSAALIELGRLGEAISELEPLTAAHPLRERLWALLVRGLAASGRQADALATIRRIREILADELGIDPGPELRRLQEAVLAQDPAVVGSAPPDEASAPGGRATASPTPQTPEGALAAAPWPLVGRDEQKASLESLLELSDGGVPSFAALTGEPGIGKSRLAAEVIQVARSRSARILVGRCSQDEGAPPLWPWAAVLATLGHDLPHDAAHEDAGSRFRAWDAIVATVREEARAALTVLLLEDLHWADTSTLRVLRLLVESVSEGRLLVLATWREHPPPTGRLAEVAEAFARRHALRVQLVGLDTAHSAEIVSAVTGGPVDSDAAAALHRRTEGNPFFLVEYARLAAEGGDLGAVVSEPHPPVAVGEVLRRRLDRLDENVVETLRAASVSGREMQLSVVADVLGRDQDAVLEDVEQACAAGLVREAGPERFRFAHALVRDTLLTSLSATRRARLHARFAEAVAGTPGSEASVARHWLEAGPTWADRAWRAAAEAAALARMVHAYEESAELLGEAVTASRSDPSATPEDRYALLTARADALQLGGNWVELRPVAHEAIAIAQEMGDLDRVVAAAVLPSTGAIWQASHHGEVDGIVVDALRRLLEVLPPADSAGRCRVLMALAMEVYYGSDPHEREVLADEGVAMARRLGDPVLVRSACIAASVAIWRGRTAPRRRELIDEAVELARTGSDRVPLMIALTLQAEIASELGDVDLLEASAAEARALTAEQRHPYSELVLDCLEGAWAAARGEDAQVDDFADDVVALSRTMNLPQLEDGLIGLRMMQLMWQRREAEILDVLLAMETTSKLPTTAAVVAFLCRLGRVDEARQHLTTHPVDLDSDWWVSPLVWCLAAEASFHLGDEALARGVLPHLEPLAGRPGCAGSGSQLGPVDAYLALATEVLGDHEQALRYADRAEDLCVEWRLPLTGRWWRETRTAAGLEGGPTRSS